MPIILDGPEDRSRLTFSQLYDNYQAERTQSESIDSVVLNEVATASESETSPILYSLRDKKTVSQSSQLQFLSQMNNVLNSPSPSPSPLQIHKPSQKKVRAPRAKTKPLSLISNPIASYQQLINRLSTIPITVDSLRKHFNLKELQFILSQNQATVTSRHNKIQLATALLQLIQNQAIPTQTELPLSQEFPWLSKHQPEPAVFQWTSDSGNWMEEFPWISQQVVKVYSRQAVLLSALRTQSFELNEWSSLNETLFDFKLNSKLVIYVPDYVQNYSLLQAVYSQGSTLAAPFLQPSVLDPEQSSWVEAEVVKKSMFTIYQGVFVYALTLLVDKQEYVTLQLPREVIQSAYLLPYPLLYHYIEGNYWSPQEKDIILLQNQLAEIQQVKDPFHIVIQPLRVVNRKEIQLIGKELVIHPWDVQFVVLTKK